MKIKILNKFRQKTRKENIASQKKDWILSPPRKNKFPFFLNDEFSINQVSFSKKVKEKHLHLIKSKFNANFDNNKIDIQKTNIRPVNRKNVSQ